MRAAQVLERRIQIHKSHTQAATVSAICKTDSAHQRCRWATQSFRTGIAPVEAKILGSIVQVHWQDTTHAKVHPILRFQRGHRDGRVATARQATILDGDVQVHWTNE
jgi:hypothetical protein